MTTRVHLDDEVRRFLEEPRIAVLATVNPDGAPQLSAIWYELQEEVILMNTRRGRLKDRNLRRDARCSLCVEDGYRYVTIRGIAQLIDDQEVAQADIKHLSARYHGMDIAERQVREQFSKEHRVTIHMSIDRISLYGFGK
ncbi:MAG TPA: PPOX class F420-dependent oxidoreductase [Chloroflexota bacterium]